MHCRPGGVLYLNAGPSVLHPAKDPSSLTSATVSADVPGAAGYAALRTKLGALLLSAEQVAFLPVAPEPLPNLFADRTLLREHDLKQVYVVYAGLKYTVALADFFAQGYEFSDVKAVQPWVLGLFPDGGAFTPSVLTSADGAH